MVIELVIVWVLAVVAFFVLWALLAKVIKRISEKRHEKDTTEATSVKNDISGEIS
jgi:flagellar biosynthesis/type III secretory pathway M-ring protein FliF/YscJ